MSITLISINPTAGAARHDWPYEKKAQFLKKELQSGPVNGQSPIESATH